MARIKIVGAFKFASPYEKLCLMEHIKQLKINVEYHSTECGYTMFILPPARVQSLMLFARTFLSYPAYFFPSWEKSDGKFEDKLVVLFDRQKIGIIINEPIKSHKSTYYTLAMWCKRRVAYCCHATVPTPEVGHPEKIKYIRRDNFGYIDRLQ